MSSPTDPSSPRDSFDQLEPGFLVGDGRYTLKRLIGAGRRSVVWLAQDGQLGEDLALKFFSAAITSQPGILADLRREVQLFR